MRIAIIGAGIMGCCFGGKLSVDNEVFFFDVSDSAIDAINQNGIIIDSPDAPSQTYSASAYKSGTDTGQVDIAFVFVKTRYTESALLTNASVIGQQTILVSLQNGAGHENELLKFAPAENIVLGTTMNSCDPVAPGHIRRTNIGMTHIGGLNGDTPATKKVAELLGSGDFTVERSGDIKKMIWDKLFVNLALNPTTAVLQCTKAFVGDDPDLWDIAVHTVNEGLAVAKADGYAFDSEYVVNKITQIIAADDGGATSMFNDIKNGCLTEIDHMNGVVSEKGRQYGIPTPYNDVIVKLIHAFEHKSKYDKP